MIPGFLGGYRAFLYSYKHFRAFRRALPLAAGGPCLICATWPVKKQMIVPAPKVVRLARTHSHLGARGAEFTVTWRLDETAL